MIAPRYSDGLTSHRVGAGPYYVEYGRDADGRLLWVEITSVDQALFRADKPPGEDQLWIAIDMVQAHNARLGREVAA